MKHSKEHKGNIYARLVLLFMFILLPLQQAGAAETYTSVTNGDWGSDATWSGLGVPDLSDTVYVNHNITFGGEYDVGTLNLQSGYLQSGSYFLNISAGGSWTGGTLNAGTYNNFGTFGISGSSKYLYGTLNNSGTINHAITNGSYLFISGGAALNNSGIYNIQNDSDFSYVGSGTRTITNTGTFIKSGGTGTSSIAAQIGFYNNGGTLQADSGTLDIGSLNSTNGTFNAADGATLLLQGGTLTGLHTGSGTGTVSLSG
ncbi:MAG: hypothetical protein HY806_07480, partial [Nitrospirae bacterium]|nr:hypothetical protein [Nitrospirota bacterium]